MTERECGPSVDETRALCGYPVIYDMGQCCGHIPCTLEWRRPCDAEGGCWDRSTCPGCEEPVWPATPPEDAR